VIAGGMSYGSMLPFDTSGKSPARWHARSQESRASSFAG